MELSWQTQWSSGKREGWPVLPQGEGAERGGEEGGAGGDDYGGKSPGSDLFEWVNTEGSVGSGEATTVPPRTRRRKKMMTRRRRLGADGGLDEGMGMEAAQASQRSNQTKSEEEPGTSLFHRILEQRQLRNPDEELKFLLQRLVVIACLPQCLDDRQSVGAYHEKLNQRLQRLYPGENITGLLLVYPTCVLHVIECSSEVLAAVLQDLSKMEEDPKSSVLEWPRVLLVSHDVPSRLFQRWEWRELNLNLPPATTTTITTTRFTFTSTDSTVLGEDHVPETTEMLVSQVLKLLLRLGNHLLTGTQTQTSTVSPENTVAELPENLLVPQTILSQLLQSTELLTPQQYLQAYHTPIHLLIDSGETPTTHLYTCS
ncbi:hypothetical protein ACEWY4_026004 [Coilia grayii]|uniref:BLUF domain-containing protein n=1 Tax=Coilia grayii TaxID=363190 RepID=A0ABD1ITV9_9TELE